MKRVRFFMYIYIYICVVIMSCRLLELWLPVNFNY